MIVRVAVIAGEEGKTTVYEEINEEIRFYNWWSFVDQINYGVEGTIFMEKQRDKWNYLNYVPFLAYKLIYMG